MLKRSFKVHSVGRKCISILQEYWSGRLEWKDVEMEGWWRFPRVLCTPSYQLLAPVVLLHSGTGGGSTSTGGATNGDTIGSQFILGWLRRLWRSSLLWGGWMGMNSTQRCGCGRIGTEALALVRLLTQQLTQLQGSRMVQSAVFNSLVESVRTNMGLSAELAEFQSISREIRKNLCLTKYE